MTHRAIVPFKHWHLEWLLENDEATEEGAMVFPPEVLQQLEQAPSWTAQIDGYPIACGGFTIPWRGRSQVWAIMNSRTAPFMGWLTREAKKKFTQQGGRIEMSVRSDFAKGHKWARILGFEVEVEEMKQYGPEGESHVGYVLLAGDT